MGSMGSCLLWTDDTDLRRFSPFELFRRSIFNGLEYGLSQILVKCDTGGGRCRIHELTKSETNLLRVQVLEQHLTNDIETGSIRQEGAILVAFFVVRDRHGRYSLSAGSQLV